MPQAHSVPIAPRTERLRLMALRAAVASAAVGREADEGAPDSVRFVGPRRPPSLGSPPAVGHTPAGARYRGRNYLSFPRWLLDDANSSGQSSSALSPFRDKSAVRTQMSQFATESLVVRLDQVQIGRYLSECTEHGAPKDEGSPDRQSLRRGSIGLAGRRRHRLGAFLCSRAGFRRSGSCRLIPTCGGAHP